MPSIISTGILLATVTIFLRIWLSKGVQDWCHKWLKLLKLASKLPGPTALPLIGNALQLVCHPNDLLKKGIEICKPYEKPFRFWIGPKLAVVLTQPCDIQVILSSSKTAYKAPQYRLLEPFLGRGLITSSGSTHKAHRRVISPMFNTKVLELYVEYFDRQSVHCADRLEELVDTGEFDILPLMEYCTVDIILDTIMGSKGTSQQGGYAQLIHATRRMYELINARFLKVWLHPDWIFACTNEFQQQTEAMSVIHGFTENLIAKKKTEHHAGKRGSIEKKEPRTVLLEQLIDHIDETNLMDDVQLRDEIYTLFTAAQDTTATICSFVFLMLGMHSEIQDKVRAELFEVLGNRNVTATDLPELKYTDMVIKETLRLFPIAPLMIRELQDEIDLDTCTLPAGCTVAVVPFVTHRHSKHWVNPEQFDPRRFEPENSAGRHSYAYIPFSSGLRGCIGQKYAMMCMKTIVANVVRRYRLTCSGSLEQLRLKADISVRSIDGYKLSITKIF